MERHDEPAGTRDLISGGGAEPPAETEQADRPVEADAEGRRDAPAAEVIEAPPAGDADAGAVPAERTETESAPEPARDGDRTDAGDAGPLLEDSERYQARWEEIQVRFVDEPRGAVEEADALVATVMKSLAEGFAQERERLEAQWGRGEDISTEDLRVALQRYRTFFQRLLST